MSADNLRDLYTLLAQASDDDEVCRVETNPEPDPTGQERSEVKCVRIAAADRYVPLECHVTHRPESRIAMRFAEIMQQQQERKRRTN